MICLIKPGDERECRFMYNKATNTLVWFVKGRLQYDYVITCFDDMCQQMYKFVAYNELLDMSMYTLSLNESDTDSWVDDIIDRAYSSTTKKFTIPKFEIRA